MSDFVKVISSYDDFFHLSEATEGDVMNAEQKLGVKFAREYRDYVSEYGVASANGHELTGVCKPARLNVVNVTLAQREYFPEAYAWYVVEEANIDGIVVWQDSDGNVFQTAPGMKSFKLASSLGDYMQGNWLM